MKYRSENLEKLKELSDEISAYENVEKQEITCALLLLCSLIEKPRVNKKAIIEHIHSIINKLEL